MTNLSNLAIARAPLSQRTTRRPNHNFYVKHRPYTIQPVMIAPVLPGETLKRARIQMRSVTDPVANPIIGWWDEMALFYVKLRDLYARDSFVSMLLIPGTDITALDSATSTAYYHVNGVFSPAINWPSLCLARVVDEFFRDEGEVSTDYVLADNAINMPVSSVNINNLGESLIPKASIVGAANIDQNLISASAGQGDATAGTVYTSEIDKAMREWENARFLGVSKMSFEDWCQQFGVQFPKEQLERPELLHYTKQWSYPTNTIDPTNGAARSAVSWSHQIDLDKDYFFREPGFLFAVRITRPKIYFKNQRAHGTILMNNSSTWLPPTTANDPAQGFVEVAASDPPFSGVTAAHLLDIKDLFLHGDQFTNLDITAQTDMNVMTLPVAAGTNRKYPTLTTDVDNLFATTTAGLGKVRCDGLCSLTILGRQVETSPVHVGSNKTV